MLSIGIVSIILGWCAVNSAPFITKPPLSNIVSFAHAQSDSELNNESPSPFDVIFVARPEGEDIYAIWGSDGTEAGTQLIKNIRPGERADIGPHKGFVKVGHISLFAANDGINGRELWRTDGTTGGTYMLKDLKGELLTEGWCTPGDPDYPMCDSICEECESEPFMPWCQDPYPYGCSICAGSSNISDYDFVSTGSKLFFFVDNDYMDDELWISDGSATGTTLVRSFSRVGSQTMAVAGNRIFFSAADGSGYGSELWISDGTAGGTYMVKDIYPGSDWSSPWNITGFGNKVVFACDDGTHGREPWISDGTEVGTYMIKDLVPGSGSPDPGLFAAVGSKTVFRASVASSGSELWVTNGTPGNATLVDIQPGSSGSNLGCFTTIDNNLWFIANDGIHGYEPWIFDGTTATMVKDINPGSADGTPYGLSIGFAKGHDGRVYFQAKDPSGNEPWVSDGTETGTEKLKFIYVDSKAGGFTPACGVTYFSAFDWPATGAELWKTDGTEAGTVIVKDIWPGTGSSYAGKITSIAMPDVDVSPLTYNFGEVKLGESSDAIVSISNIGSGDLTVQNVNLIDIKGYYSILSLPTLPVTLSSNQTLDVYITFTPSVAGDFSAILEITSDDPDEGLVGVTLGGTGVQAKLPPSEQLAQILEFFDTCVTEGTLSGNGLGNSAEGRLGALRNMIEASGDLINGELFEEACQQLLDAYNRTDGNPKPPDFVTGDSAQELAVQIKDLRTSLGCE